MVNDQEPRYRLVDSNGNVVGSLFQNADGNVEIQDETGTGSVFGPNGIVTPAIDAESVSTDQQTTEKSVCVAALDSDQSIEDGTETKVEVDLSPNFATDQLDAFDEANNKFVSPSDGTYSVSAQVQGAESIDNTKIRIVKNGNTATFIDGDIGARFEGVASPSHELELSEGDEIELRFEHDHGSARNIEGFESQNRTWIKIRRV